MQNQFLWNDFKANKRESSQQWPLILKQNSFSYQEGRNICFQDCFVVVVVVNL